MAKHYAIWDKQSPVLTPSGEIFTAAEWKAKFPVAALDNITVVCAAGEINGALFGTLGQMKQNFEQRGCDFSACTSDQEILQAIEDFEDAEQAAKEASASAPTAEERQAAALEAIATGATAETTAAMDALLTGEE